MIKSIRNVHEGNLLPNVILALDPVGQQHACLQQGLSSVHGFQGFTMLILGLGWVKEQGSWQWSKELVALVGAPGVHQGSECQEHVPKSTGHMPDLYQPLVLSWPNGPHCVCEAL